MIRVLVSLATALLVSASSTSAQVAALAAAPAAVVDRDPPSGSRPASRDARIVWDDALGGIRVTSARTDDSDRVVLYESRTQDAYNLALSPDESLVAFSPFDRRGPRTRLVVASTTTPRARDILPRNSGVVGIGPIGWSRDGRRLVFMSFVDEPDHPTVRARLFSISRTGEHLRRGRPVNATAPGVAMGDLVVTRSGIVQKDGTTIRLFPTFDATSRPRVIARDAYAVRASGNGRWLFYQRSTPRGRQSLQKVRSTGGRSTTVLRYRVDGLDKPFSYAADTTGTRLVVSGQAEDGSPSSSILDLRDRSSTDLDFARGKLSIAW